jgi:hypothetical protein
MQVEIYERFLSGPEDGYSRLLGKVWGLPSNMTSHFRRQSRFENKYVSLVKKRYWSSRILSLYLPESFIFGHCRDLCFRERCGHAVFITLLNIGWPWREHGWKASDMSLGEMIKRKLRLLEWMSKLFGGTDVLLSRYSFEWLYISMPFQCDWYVGSVCSAWSTVMQWLEQRYDFVFQRYVVQVPAYSRCSEFVFNTFSHLFILYAPYYKVGARIAQSV